MVLHVAAIQGGVTNLGPGRRIVVWVEGCSLRCPGCMAPELFDARPESVGPAAGVFEEIARLAAGHVGLTISGGEPFQQAAALGELSRW